MVNTPRSFTPLRPPRPGPALATTAEDLDALRSAMVDASTVSGSLWLSYLFALFYLLVAAGSVTHKDLLLAYLASSCAGAMGLSLSDRQLLEHVANPPP